MARRLEVGVEEVAVDRERRGGAADDADTRSAPELVQVAADDLHHPHQDLDLPPVGDLVLEVLVGPAEPGLVRAEGALSLCRVGRGDEHPHDVDHRHRVGDDGGLTLVAKGAGAVVAAVHVEDVGRGARGHEVRAGAVEEHVLGRSRAAEQDFAGTRAQSFGHQAAWQAGYAGVAVHVGSGRGQDGQAAA